MAQVPKMDARMVQFVVDDLRRRRLPVDGVLKEVGLQRADLANPEGRLPYASAVGLIARAAILAGDASYGLHLAASLDAREFGCSVSWPSIRPR
jgi:AraC-type transcriptional regulator